MPKPITINDPGARVILGQVKDMDPEEAELIRKDLTAKNPDLEKLRGKDVNEYSKPWEQLDHLQKQFFINYALSRGPFTPSLWYRYLIDDVWDNNDPASHALTFIGHLDGDYSFPPDPSDNDTLPKQQLITKFYGSILVDVLAICKWWVKLKADNDLSFWETFSWKTKFIRSPFTEGKLLALKTEQKTRGLIDEAKGFLYDVGGGIKQIALIGLGIGVIAIGLRLTF